MERYKHENNYRIRFFLHSHEANSKKKTEPNYLYSRVDLSADTMPGAFSVTIVRY